MVAAVTVVGIAGEVDLRTARVTVVDPANQSQKMAAEAAVTGTEMTFIPTSESIKAATLIITTSNIQVNLSGKRICLLI